MLSTGASYKLAPLLFVMFVVFFLPLAPSKGGELRISPAGGGLRGWI